ncbi:MAG: hypothetical protein JWN47_672 [Frankiales bacterium]|nr:hypothetical protein [Frankiales bacterium]
MLGAIAAIAVELSGDDLSADDLSADDLATDVLAADDLAEIERIIPAGAAAGDGYAPAQLAKLDTERR